ncbi:MAG: hypothetical protein LBG17_03250 [Bacteroidales bacterium]|jgi:hypothetical protein|nr:hypothetical protein [Bacteroidales bacterium]
MDNIQRYNAKRYKKKEISVQRSIAQNEQDNAENMDILYRAQLDWNSLSQFRERAIRALRYSEGNQWDDIIKDPDTGQYISEKDLIRKQGKTPLVQNKIGSIIRNLLGQYRSNSSKAVVLVRDTERTQEEEVLTDILSAINTLNETEELDANIFTTALHSTMEVQRISFRYFKEFDRNDVFIENVGFDSIFFNSNIKDIRMKDLCRIGMFHDINKTEFVSQFSKSKADIEYLERKFDALTSAYDISQGLSGGFRLENNFMQPYDRQTIRVYELWQLETKASIYVFDRVTGTEGLTDLTERELQAINDKRIADVMDYNAQVSVEEQIPQEDVELVRYEFRAEPQWVYRYMLYDGTCLQKGATPYKHQEHPFVMRIMPVNIVYQMIDLQRMINRISIMWDFMRGAGAKGVLLLPEDMIPEGKSPQDFADEWVRFDGVIVYTPSTKHAHMPQQVTAASVPAGDFELFNIYIKMMEDISGVHAAIQGKQSVAGMSGKLYQQETINSSMNTLDIMKVHAAFERARDRKTLKTALQFYNGKRRIISSGVNGGVIEVDTDKIRDLDFDTQIIDNTDTQAYRQIVEDRLVQMVTQGLIPPDVYFKNSSDSTSKKIYEDMKQLQEQQAQAMQGGEQVNISPEMQAQAGKANPQAVELLQRAVGMQGGNNTQSPPLA